MFRRAVDLVKGLDCCGLLGTPPTPDAGPGSHTARRTRHGSTSGAAGVAGVLPSRACSSSIDSTTPLLSAAGAARRPRAALPTMPATGTFDQNLTVAEVSPAVDLAHNLNEALSGDLGVGSLVAKHSLSQGEIELAGYILSREIVGRPISDDLAGKLRQALEVVEKTREALPYGRANVPLDLDKTQDQGAYRTNVGRHHIIAEQLERGVFVGFSPQAASVEMYFLNGAAARIMGSGVCDEHASIAAIVMANKLAAGEEVGLMVRPGHTWAEHHLANVEGGQMATNSSTSHSVEEDVADRGGNGRTSPNILVLDAWSDGPPMKASDTWFAKDRGQVVKLTSVTADQSAAAVVHFDETVAQMDRRWSAHVDESTRVCEVHIGEIRRDHPSIWTGSTAAVDPAFASLARSSIEALGNDHAIRLASAVAARVFGMSADAVIRTAPAILKSAKELDKVGPARGLRPVMPSE